MKRTFFTLLCFAFIISCNQSANKTETDEDAGHQPGDTTELSLNNGSKWKVDLITNHNVVNLKTIADNFRIKPFPSMNDYQVLSGDLQNGLNTMIQECKMTGPDHEALHHWLNPILQETSQLKNAADTSAGRTIFKSIDKQLHDYHKYFE